MTEKLVGLLGESRPVGWLFGTVAGEGRSPSGSCEIEQSLSISSVTHAGKKYPKVPST